LEVPKGSAQSGETPAQAAMREVLEESGLRELALIKELGVTRSQSIACSRLQCVCRGDDGGLRIDAGRSAQPCESV
jgi:8-oxo-dGTP pyrophosphatase MutT (NUDIX family)